MSTSSNKIDDVCTAVRFAMDQLALKEKQKEAIHNFVRVHDCFVILPTGYGKTCYALLPFVLDHLRKRTLLISWLSTTTTDTGKESKQRSP